MAPKASVRKGSSLAKRSFFAFLLCFLLAAPSALAQGNKGNEGNKGNKGYKLPPQSLVDLVDAPTTPGISLSPDNRTMLLLEKIPLKSIRELTRPELNLAGLSIDPMNHGESRLAYVRNLRVKGFPHGIIRRLKGLPPSPRIAHISWSPDSRWLAFTVTAENKIGLWLGDPRRAEAKKLGDRRLNAVLGTPYAWLPDSKGLICRTVPEGLAALPPGEEAVEGPIVQETSGKRAPARTFPDLLRTPHDELMFEHYLAVQLVRVSLDGKAQPLGRKGLFLSAEPSPNGRFILTEALRRPYSHTVPFQRFPLRDEVLDSHGKLVARVAELPLAETVPLDFDAVRTGRRFIDWRQDEPATLYWVEALDGGDPKAQAPYRDALYTLRAPFRGEPQPFARLSTRFEGIEWGKGIAVLSESWNKDRRSKSWLVYPDGQMNKMKKMKQLFDVSTEDRYGDPGSFVARRDSRGCRMLVRSQDGKSLYLVGPGASPEGDRPFFDRLDLETGKIERLWRSQAPYYEYVVKPLSEQTLLISRESPTQSPNYYRFDLPSGKWDAVTAFPNPIPQLAGIRKELISYRRADGVKLSGMLYLPSGNRPGPFPMLMWAYPTEYKNPSAAGQANDSPYRFERIHASSPVLWASQGYAVLDDPSIPIIGEGKQEPNDTYLEQLVAGAKAAVDEVVRRGVADPRRIAIGGHSYGAFMAANLLAHSELFCAGIARSGAYNRTLTPFGFQSEERTLWEAPEVYAKMSPFNHADRLNEPLLLIHGQADSNPGTFTLQSERLFQAIRGLGGTARLVLLPGETHTYRARESILHVLYETNAWLEQYVKNRK